MSAFIYLALLATVVVAALVYMDRRWARYIAGARRAERIAKVSQTAVVTPKNADGLDELWLELLATPKVPQQRRPGGAS